MSVLLLDHEGLGTYSLAQYLGELGADTNVYHAKQLSLEDIAEVDPSHILLSPSTHTLTEAIAIMLHFGAKKPILGIGLGFVAAIQAMGSHTSIANTHYAGERLLMHHNNEGIFHNLPQSFKGVCYQRQTVNLDNLPKMLDITAWSQLADETLDVILAVKHQTWPLQALLFQPEAMLSEQGHTLLRNFLR